MHTKITSTSVSTEKYIAKTKLQQTTVTLEELQRSTEFIQVKSSGLYGRVTREKLLLTESHQKSSLKLLQTVTGAQETWRKMLWSKEKYPHMQKYKNYVSP